MKKELALLDTSLGGLRAFPESFRQEIGCQLDRIQQGLNPYNWKPFSIIGPGVREIRTRDTDGIYRVVYITKFEETVYVLHCFQKKTQTINQSGIDLDKRRCKEPVQERENGNWDL